jgi:hypothetical protein
VSLCVFCAVSAFNDESDEAVVVDRISPPELNQQNVFYAEEAERKLIVAQAHLLYYLRVLIMDRVLVQMLMK